MRRGWCLRIAKLLEGTPSDATNRLGGMAETVSIPATRSDHSTDGFPALDAGFSDSDDRASVARSTLHSTLQDATQPPSEDEIRRVCRLAGCWWNHVEKNDGYSRRLIAACAALPAWVVNRTLHGPYHQRAWYESERADDPFPQLLGGNDRHRVRAGYVPFDEGRATSRSFFRWQKYAAFDLGLNVRYWPATKTWTAAVRDDDALVKAARAVARSAKRRMECRAETLDGIEEARRRHGSLYFIQVGDAGPIKIGRGKNPRKRLAALQTGNPHRLRIVATTPDGFTEQWWHGKFSHLRMEGEWFEPADELINAIQRHVGSVA